MYMYVWMFIIVIFIYFHHSHRLFLTRFRSLALSEELATFEADSSDVFCVGGVMIGGGGGGITTEGG